MTKKEADEKAEDIFKELNQKCEEIIKQAKKTGFGKAVLIQTKNCFLK